MLPWRQEDTCSYLVCPRHKAQNRYFCIICCFLNISDLTSKPINIWGGQQRLKDVRCSNHTPGSSTFPPQGFHSPLSNQNLLPLLDAACTHLWRGKFILTCFLHSSVCFSLFLAQNPAALTLVVSSVSQIHLSSGIPTLTYSPQISSNLKIHFHFLFFQETLSSYCQLQGTLLSPKDPTV